VPTGTLAPSGGGGGGLYGGGGGGVQNDVQASSGGVVDASPGGGGGGSSLVPAGGLAKLDENEAPPSVTISYTVGETTPKLLIKTGAVPVPVGTTIGSLGSSAINTRIGGADCAALALQGKLLTNGRITDQLEVTYILSHDKNEPNCNGGGVVVYSHRPSLGILRLTSNGTTTITAAELDYVLVEYYSGTNCTYAFTKLHGTFNFVNKEWFYGPQRVARNAALSDPTCPADATFALGSAPWEGFEGFEFELI
jgi:hypothetical protein